MKGGHSRDLLVEERNARRGLSRLDDVHDRGVPIAREYVDLGGIRKREEERDLCRVSGLVVLIS